MSNDTAFSEPAMLTTDTLTEFPLSRNTIISSHALLILHATQDKINFKIPLQSTSQCPQRPCAFSFVPPPKPAGWCICHP